MNSHNHKINVMHVVLNLERAGAQEVVRSLTKYLQSDKCQVTICTFCDGPLRPEIEKLGVKVEILRRPRYAIYLLPLFLAEMLRIRRELAHLIATYKIDILQTHILEVLDFVVLSVRRNTRAQVVLWTIQNVEFLPTQQHRLLKLRRTVYRLLYRWLSKYVDGFVAVSDEVRHTLIQQLGNSIEEKIFVSCNGVDLALFDCPSNKLTLCEQWGLPSDSCLIGTIGRLTEQKGHCYLIEAAKTVVELNPNTHFLFAGSGELKRELELQVEVAGLAEHIHFIGVQDNIPELLATVDIFVLPSLWEGLSVALLEAMAARKPIIATGVSGTSQVMFSGETGLVVPPADSHALAKAIVQLLANPVHAQEMAQIAQERVRVNFSARKQADEHMIIYQQLLDQKKQEEGL